MHRDRVAALYDVHSWAGVLFAVLVFIVCASGAIAVFSSELDHWSNPALRTPAGARISVDIDRAFASFAAVRPIPVGDDTSIGLPRELRNSYEIFARKTDEPQARLYVDATSGAVHEARQSYLFWYLRHLHVRLMSPEYGRLFVGIIGIAMLLSVATGVLIHKHLLRDLFRMRWKVGRGGRALMSELHKWVGVWGLLFHLTISLTGTWLALESYISPVIRAGLSAPEEPAAQADTSPSSVTAASMLPLAPLLERAKRDLAGLEPTYIGVEKWGTRAATVTVAGNLPGALIQESVAHVQFSAVSGDLEVIDDPRTQGFWAQLRAALEPLHYGYYGGFWLKVLYLLSGFTPALLSLTGALIWFDRRSRLQGTARRRDGAVSAASESTMRRTLVALVSGSWIALLGALVLPLPAALAGAPVGSATMTPLFYGLWAAATAWMFTLRFGASMGQTALRVGAALMVVIPLLAWSTPHDAIGMGLSIGATVLAACQWYVASRLLADRRCPQWRGDQARKTGGS